MFFIMLIILLGIPANSAQKEDPLAKCTTLTGSSSPTIAKMCQGNNGAGAHYSYTGSNDPGLSGLPALRTDNKYLPSQSEHMCRSGSCEAQETDINVGETPGDRTACCTAKCELGYGFGDYEIMTPVPMDGAWKVNTFTCKACPAGQYGAYASDDGINECLVCPPGRYQESMSSTDCDACEAGKYFGMSALGAKSVDDCITCGAHDYAKPVETGPKIGGAAEGQTA